MTTTTKKTRRAPETLTDYIYAELERAKAAYEEAKDEFADDFATNPTSTIEWKANAMVAAQKRFVYWTRLAKAAALETATDGLVLDLATGECQREIENFFGSNSTCPWHNAARRAEAEIADRILRNNIPAIEKLASKAAANAAAAVENEVVDLIENEVFSKVGGMYFSDVERARLAALLPRLAELLNRPSASKTNS